MPWRVKLGHNTHAALSGVLHDCCNIVERVPLARAPRCGPQPRICHRFQRPRLPARVRAAHCERPMHTVQSRARGGRRWFEVVPSAQRLGTGIRHRRHMRHARRAARHLMCHARALCPPTPRGARLCTHQSTMCQCITVIFAYVKLSIMRYRCCRDSQCLSVSTSTPRHVNLGASRMVMGTPATPYCCVSNEKRMA